MSKKHPGIKDVVGFLDRLQQTIRDTVTAGGQLDHQFRTLSHRERQKVEAELAEAELPAETAEAEAAAQAVRDHVAARFAQRQARILRAGETTLASLMREIDEQESRRKFEIQRDLLHEERTREAHEKIEAAYVQFCAALTESQARHAALSERAWDSFVGCRGLLKVAPSVATEKLSDDENVLLEQHRTLLTKIGQDLDRFRAMPLPRVFRLLPLAASIPLLIVGHAGYAVGAPHFGGGPVIYGNVGTSLGACLVVVILLAVAARRQSRPLGAAVGNGLALAQRVYETCLQQATAKRQKDLEDAENQRLKRIDDLHHAWTDEVGNASLKREAARSATSDKVNRIIRQLDRAHAQWQEHAEQEGQSIIDRVRAVADKRKQALLEALETRQAQARVDYEARWRVLSTALRNVALPAYQSVTAATTISQSLFPDWQPRFYEQWTMPAEFAHAVKLGQLDVDLEKLTGVSVADPHLDLPGPAKFSTPLLLSFPQQGSLLLETGKTGRDDALAALNNIVLRLLSVTPTSRLNFTLIDPVGLGQSFSGVTHLSDYGDNLIQGRICTQPAQIEKRLAELNEHMEKVIQLYLRNEYETITEYNEKAGNIAEKYHYLVVADFPSGFTETSAKRLLSIAASGARCGVFTLIHWDRRQQQPHDLLAEDLRKVSACLVNTGGQFTLPGHSTAGLHLTLDPLPDPASTTAFIQKVGEASIRANRVEVPFSYIMPDENERWSIDTTREIRVPIGRTGATKLQYLALGQGTRQHALIAGKTGSGKSTLFHVIITNLALWCSPEQIEFYLVDFKKGVEFQCYAAKHLPHARVIAIESDREFGLSVLQRVDEELRRRGELFRGLGVQDIAGYKKAGGTEPIPRSLLMIDEFQEFFVEDDRVSQNASLLLDRIVRQGRAFGIHVILGSQTLGGAYSLARTTIGQMVVRIALQCNEADAYLIMDDTNPAPRLLTRPGEGIYNDAAGAIDGNSPFQTVWLSDDVREAQLDIVHDLAKGKSISLPAPIVFDGNAPADIRENPLLRQVLSSPATVAPNAARIWLGAPNSIKGPTEVAFQRQSGSNLLVVGQREEAALAILSVALASLAAQYPAGRARIIVFDGNPPGSPEKEYLDRMARAAGSAVTVARGSEIEAVLNQLATDLKAGGDSATTSHPETFLFIQGLQKFKRLRFEEDFGYSSSDSEAAPNPGQQLNSLICDGPGAGIHVIAICDTYNNVNRLLSRKALGEFEMRVLFQMSATDSASLIDSPKAGSLGLHRAVFYNEQEGYLEVFRPYALPESDWVDSIARHFSGSQ